MKKLLKVFLKSLFSLTLCLCLVAAALPTAFAGEKKTSEKGNIIFIPHDNRPISDKQTADTIRELGYKVIVPPDDMLGSREDQGNPDKLWEWLETNTDKKNKEIKKELKNLKAVVVSADSLLYGSLVGSRKHSYSQEQVLSRVEKFNDFRKEHPNLNFYSFASIMRTPRTGEASGTEEPSYYKNYGADIFRFTALGDKAETDRLTRREQKEYDFLKKLIPQEALDDWLSRRNKNFAANKAMIDMTRGGVFNYFVLGRDDNAPYSQTHMEGRKLSELAKDLNKSHFQNMAGIDEIAMLLLARAVNDNERTVPFVSVVYNYGRGPRTIPAYSDETIETSIRSAIETAGGMQVSKDDKADLVLYVNTDPNGKTLEANTTQNTAAPRNGTKYFADIVEEAIAAGKPVAVGDIAFANGADNAFMEIMKNRGLLFKLRAYSGWNTPTNSTGFVIGQGVLSGRMSDESKDKLLLTRYLDDWAYQSNIRQVMSRQLGWFRGSGFYTSLNEKRSAIEHRSTKLMRRWVENNLPPFDGLQGLQVHYPWNRMFESDIELGVEEDLPSLLLTK